MPESAQDGQNGQPGEHVSGQKCHYWQGDCGYWHAQLAYMPCTGAWWVRVGTQGVCSGAGVRWWVCTYGYSARAGPSTPATRDLAVLPAKLGVWPLWPAKLGVLAQDTR